MRNFYFFVGILSYLSCFLFRMYAQQSFIPLRYLAINVGNASPQFGCWEYKLCRAQDVANLRNYIATWQPDVIMISEVYMHKQLKDTMFNGPILPSGYDGICHPSIDRTTGDTVAWNAPNSSHEHECIAWKTSRMQLIPGSAKSVFGRNDSYGSGNCNYDFTGFRVKLLLDGQDTITAVAVHPNSSNAQCRTYEINNYWSQLAQGSKVIIGGDWNSDNYNEILPPSNFQINFSKGNYWNLAYFPSHYSATYIWPYPDRHLDHTFSNFGLPCTNCGAYYGTTDLIYGAALGGITIIPAQMEDRAWITDKSLWI